MGCLLPKRRQGAKAGIWGGSRGPERDAASGQLTLATLVVGEARGLSEHLHTPQSLPLFLRYPPPFPRGRREKRQHLAQRWGGKSERERRRKQAEKGREGEKGRVHEHDKVTNMAPHLSPHPRRERRRALNSSHLPTPQQSGPHALSPGASGYIDQKLYRTREAQNLLCASERKRRQREGEGAGGGGKGVTLLKYNTPFLLFNPGGSLSSPPLDHLFHPDASRGS